MNQHQSNMPIRPQPNDDGFTWRNYWQEVGYNWHRRAPEIDITRQSYLSQHRDIIPDVHSGRYPFSTIALVRADVEWLLATHVSDGVVGPIDWNDEKQHSRIGLDLRGALLRGVDLGNLPLAGTIGGLTLEEWSNATSNEREMAAVHFEKGYFMGAHFENAVFTGAHFEDAKFSVVFGENSIFAHGHLERAILNGARLQHADLRNASLFKAQFYEAHLEGANLDNTNREGADFTGAYF